MAQDDYPRQRPGLGWRAASSALMGITGLLSRVFVHGGSSITVVGADPFCRLLDERRCVAARQRGLLTGAAYSATAVVVQGRVADAQTTAVSNHISVYVWQRMRRRMAMKSTDRGL